MEYFFIDQPDGFTFLHCKNKSAHSICIKRKMKKYLEKIVEPSVQNKSKLLLKSTFGWESIFIERKAIKVNFLEVKSCFSGHYFFFTREISCHLKHPGNYAA